MWITGDRPETDTLLAWPCEKIGQEAEKHRPVGIKARKVGSSRLLSNVVHSRPDTIVGFAPNVQGWSGGHKNQEEIVP